MIKKTLIVGGVAGGASTAARLRRLDENAEIIMFERDEYISFANCGLPYYIGETIKDRDKLLVQTPESMNARFNIDVRNNSEVVAIDITKKVVTVNSKVRGTYEESYDYLVLSPGAKAIKPNIEGINSERIFTLRNIPDTDNIKAYVDKKKINSAVVVGGGYVGVEMVENLKERGLKVTLVEAAPHILAPFDTDIVLNVEKEISDNGVEIILNDGVKAFKDIENGVEITLNSGTKLSADIIILAIGVFPDTKFAKDAGIKVGPKGHILVNDKMETSAEGVFAVGDAIEVIDFVNKTNTAIPLAGPANKQGRIAADNIAGLNSKYNGTQGTAILKVFGLTAASTGNNERTLTRLNIPYKVIFVHPVSHASYYPGALPMTLKLIFNEQGKILGAQGVGYDGVDKRIDVLATVIRLGGTVDDLTELELSYAPPFSSAKDPVNMAGFVAQNVLAGRMEVLTTDEFSTYDRENAVVLDVRTEIEFDNGHIEGAINIPVDNLRERIGELDKNKEIIEYCQVGLRGYVASRILAQKDFKVKNLTGGYKSVLSSEFKPNKTGDSDKIKRQKIDPDTQVIRDEVAIEADKYDKLLDACGLCCPGPLIQVKASIDELNDGQILKVTASDPGFYEDIRSWCTKTNNELLDLRKEKGMVFAFIKKKDNKIASESRSFPLEASEKNNKTMVVFSGDLDKAIAAFIIANGAVAMGSKVTILFTFWGLNIIRKPEKVSVKKGMIDSMFGFMMPRGSKKLKLSQMNMMGIGAKMIRSVMKNKNISSLEDLIKSAIDSGVEVVACSMSMDVMGITKEELIDGVKIGGVGYYLGQTEDSNVNLFI
ncbi:CoA-disulfide reductase [Clostridium estertheticum]|uniref:CoA-disulfide reductase n=1 Tax=Clostridium estertheticum TaxID=238834 RepID=UPI001CF3429D|nr:CoA-disulfide reductase [Clostridium estertheticum]MCB2305113.1 CoA-disulfide reductase [Clostridium estertheticum]MCB2343617.1 CoA-disulfide reductase [Clostridium estertheticum]MCB2348537.1 CoA-disulfide reductase [Clostridium estertheticum]WAG47481.1 CoA-disulfide reductase [Clostridium estertheticum]